MSKSDIPENKNDTIKRQHHGVIRFTFGVDSKKEVDNKAIQLANAGFRILSGQKKQAMVALNLKLWTPTITAWK